MLTTTETILLITVWVLTICGLFFGGRAKLRKRRRSAQERDQNLP
ncbi:MAG: hypothetical protein OEL80_04055 [Desulfuromonadales bacterium]|nr:hypothetical protein [Desulfuromonadales bacterium]